MVDLVYCLTNLLFFDIPLIYYYINLRSSIISCLSSGDIYLSLAISLSYSLVTVSELFCSEVFDIFVILPLCNLVLQFSSKVFDHSA